VIEKYFSVSDVQTFLQCREKWDISSPNRQSLRHRATPRMYLTQGTALHNAIEAQQKGVQNPLEATDVYLKVEREARVDQIRRETGFDPWPLEMKEWDEKAGLTRALAKQYFDHYGYENPLADQGLEYIATEVPFKIDISELVGILGAFFVGTFDGIAVDQQENLWLVENKSYQSKPDLKDLRVHFQTTGYAVAWEMLTGIPLAGALYNGVAKKLIKEPRVLNSGALSTDVSQQTTWARYTAAIKRVGGSIADPKYAKILDKLENIERQGDDRFFYRESFYFNETQIQSWTREFTDIVREMNDDPRIYRTVSFKGCGPQGADCWWQDVCFAKHTGQDVQTTIDQRYEVGSYGTIQAVDGITAVSVSSIEELREALRQHG
jgi:hypothetical protein